MIEEGGKLSTRVHYVPLCNCIKACSQMRPRLNEN